MCGILYLRYERPLQSALSRWDEMASEAQIQAEIGSQLLDDWSLISEELEQASLVHQHSLSAFENPNQRLATLEGAFLVVSCSAYR